MPCFRHRWIYKRRDGVDHVYCSSRGGYFPMAIYRCEKCGKPSRRDLRWADRLKGSS